MSFAIRGPLLAEPFATSKNWLVPIGQTLPSQEKKKIKMLKCNIQIICKKHKYMYLNYLEYSMAMRFISELILFL